MQIKDDECRDNVEMDVRVGTTLIEKEDGFNNDFKEDICYSAHTLELGNIKWKRPQYSDTYMNSCTCI